MSTYSTQQVARAAGVSFRQADHWHRSGIVAPPWERANRRAWRLTDAFAVAAVARARDAGVEGDEIRKVAALVRDHDLEWWREALRESTFVVLVCGERPVATMADVASLRLILASPEDRALVIVALAPVVRTVRAVLCAGREPAAAA